ncbi:MAG: hypothetical protein ACRD3S_01800 [Terracidiphilus sp.]
MVEKCSADATRFKPGDEVFSVVGIYCGGCSEHAVLDQDAIAAKSAELDHLHAAAIPLAGCPRWKTDIRSERWFWRPRNRLVKEPVPAIGVFVRAPEISRKWD